MVLFCSKGNIQIFVQKGFEMSWLDVLFNELVSNKQKKHIQGLIAKAGFEALMASL